MSAEAEVILNIDQFEERIRALTENLPQAMLVAVRKTVASAIRYAILEELSGQRLNRRTGNLQLNVEASPAFDPAVIEGPTSVRGAIGTNLGYGRAHERGFVGTVQVRAHSRRRLGRPLAYKISTRSVSKRAPIAKAARDQGPIQVRAHAMRMNIRARWYLRDAARHVQPELAENGLAAIRFLARTGQIPTLDAIGGQGA